MKRTGPQPHLKCQSRLVEKVLQLIHNAGAVAEHGHGGSNVVGREGCREGWWRRVQGSRRNNVWTLQEKREREAKKSDHEANLGSGRSPFLLAPSQWLGTDTFARAPAHHPTNNREQTATGVAYKRQSPEKFPVHGIA